MTEDERMRVLSLLDDVEQGLSSALRMLWDRDIDALNEGGVHLEAWRDDTKTALEIITKGMM